MQMALDAQPVRSTSPRARALKAGSIARLPLQWPMIRAALKVARA
ncbi:MAG: hypothetical protein ACR2K3_06380 [Nocardioides sp.]